MDAVSFIMKTILYIASAFIAWSTNAISQYAPAAGEPGSTAVYKDSSIFAAWGSSCKIERGFIKISDTTLAYEGSTMAMHGIAEDALGKADGKVVSLGDGGTAIYFLDTAIADKDGYDFAVFENGFKSQEPPQNYFLELAFVEVSSDGNRFVRFPAVSETMVSTQVSSFGQIDPAQIHNLAGKYAVNYGTPFDLYDLSDSSGVDIENITHIRIIDVVGNINDTYASVDVYGNKINDPWPTPFASGGFDLDALGIVNQKDNVTNRAGKASPALANIYPNPAKQGHTITIKLDDFNITNDNPNVTIFDMSGKVIFNTVLSAKQTTVGEIHLPAVMNPGMYSIQITTKGMRLQTKLLITK